MLRLCYECSRIRPSGTAKLLLPRLLSRRSNKSNSTSRCILRTLTKQSWARNLKTQKLLTNASASTSRPGRKTSTSSITSCYKWSCMSCKLKISITLSTTPCTSRYWTLSLEELHEESSQSLSTSFTFSSLLQQLRTKNFSTHLLGSVLMKSTKSSAGLIR